MKSQRHGKNISDVEVQNISNNGIWLYVNGKEYFLSYKEYPWFKDAKVSDICNLELLRDNHLYWPDLDVDLEIDSLENPEKFPLIYKDNYRG
ncbi:MAG TPA: DUF2442 domain-containing protein [Candidatus Brocadiia bacterium]|nr:DUF2442 domain-containing protein [Planctomycetota bacterium]MDO8093546.1 DUF2442 domain-containing protein [Candidatus Brocadiales bacterium]